ncbi:MAG: FixH family protein [Chromatiales bacterium]|nr:FixH family protein [Chromatiales bacterium]
MTGQFLRPSTSTLDVAFDLAEREPGVYEARTEAAGAGDWNLVLQHPPGEELHEVRASTQVLER